MRTITIIKYLLIKVSEKYVREDHKIQNIKIKLVENILRLQILIKY